MLENSSDSLNIVLFCLIRFFTHILPIVLTMYAFWHSRQEKKPDYLKFSSGTFSLASWDLDRDDVAFRSTVGENIN